jgi:hypothetical protein
MFKLRWSPPAFAVIIMARPAGRSWTCRVGRWIAAGAFVAVSVSGCEAASTTDVTPAPRTATAVMAAPTTVAAPVMAAAPATAAVPVTAAAPTTAAAVLGAPNCPLFPADNVWNTNISTLPVNTHSAAWLASMNSATAFLHPDFGPNPGGYPYGIPFTVVTAGQPLVKVTFQYASESDPGPYPFGPDTPIEGGANSGGDQHAIMVDPRTCTLYELWDAQYSTNGSTAGSGAIWQLRSNQLRPEGWTSADAAGLPILPGLLDFAQVQAAVQLGKPITHAIRFTAQVTQSAYLWPARHSASSDPSPNVPPMGARFRLKASFDVAQFCSDSQSYCPDAKAILTEMQNYGLILADNGSNWYFQGSASPQWPDALISLLKQIPAAAFQAVDESCLMVAPDSAEARAKPGCPIG